MQLNNCYENKELTKYLMKFVIWNEFVITKCLFTFQSKVNSMKLRKKILDIISSQKTTNYKWYQTW